MNCAPPQATAPATGTVVVVLVGNTTPTAPTVAAALADTNHASALHYEVSDARGAADLAPRPHVDIVVCTSAHVATVAAACPPGTDLIAVVSSYDADHEVLTALEAGATVCVRGSEPALLAAYVHAVARRRSQAHRSAS